MNAQRKGLLSTQYIEFLLILNAIGVIAILVLGNWLSRTMVVLVLVVFWGWAFWYDYRYMQFRVGDSVLVTGGPHCGKFGTVVESDLLPHGARIAFDDDKQTLADFPMGRDIEKVGARITHSHQKNG